MSQVRFLVDDQLEQDEREPTLSIAARLAGVLGLSLDELASGAA